MQLSRWRKIWLIGLVLLFVAQTIARMVAHHLAFHTSKLGDVLHLLIIAAWFGFVALAVWRLPMRWRGRPVAPIAFTLLMGGFHALASYTDIFHLIWYGYVHGAAPIWLPFQDPGLALSLLAAVNIGPLTAFGIVALILVPHLLLYAVIADPATRWIKQEIGARFRLPALRLPAIPAWLFAAAPIVAFALVSLLMPPRFWRYEMLHRTARGAFQMAPPALMLVPPPDGPAPPTVAAPAPRPLVLLIVDALRRDRIGVYNPPLANTPFLEELRTSGKLHLYSAYSPCTLSYCGIMSVLTSRSWDQFTSRPPTILDALAHHGYRNHLILTGDHHGFGNLTRQYGRGIVQLWDTGPTAPPDDRASLRTLAATRFDDPSHSFLYLHLDSAHAGSPIEPQFSKGDWPAVPYATVYDARVRQTDAMIRETFNILRTKGMLDKALVVITADHGERLGENGMLFHGGPPDEAATAVPIMVYDPLGGTWPEHSLATTLDVAPTLVRAIGGVPGDGWRGIALQDTRSHAAVPLGTGDFTGAVIELDGKRYRYLCQREEGREVVKLLDGRSLEGATIRPGPGRDRILPALRARHRQAASTGCGKQG